MSVPDDMLEEIAAETAEATLTKAIVQARRTAKDGVMDLSFLHACISPALLHGLSILLWRRLAETLSILPQEVDCVIALPTGGVPLATIFALVSERPSMRLLVPKEGAVPTSFLGAEVHTSKPLTSVTRPDTSRVFHLRKRDIEGKRVLIVDDVLASGGTLTHMIDFITAGGGLCLGALAAIHKASKRMEDVTLPRGVPFLAAAIATLD